MVDTKWVNDVKKDDKGNILRYQARKVGREFTQEYGLNYYDTFTQMARSESWRILLTLAINHGWSVAQWDVIAAYLQADLQHEIYVKDLTETGQLEYWKLHKVLYRLKQAGHEWYNRLRSIMANAGLDQCVGDPGCFRSPKGDLTICTHVDDMAGYGTPEALEAFEKTVESEVELDKLGKPTKLLGMELTWNKHGSVKLTQKDAIGKLMIEDSIPNSPRLSLPSNTSYYDQKNNQEKLQDPTIYQSIVGSLLYISRMTRPDISFIVNLVGRRTSDPSPINLAVAREVCKYLSSMTNEGVTIAKGEKGDLIKGYVDASQPKEEEASRCQSGSLVTLYGQSIMWTSRRQDVVAMSITETEYIATSEGLKDLAWVQQFLQEILPRYKKPWIPTMFTDNEAAQKLSKAQIYHRRTRHILYRFHYIRQEVDNQLVTIQRIPGKENLVDIFTKLLPMNTVKMWKTSCMKSEIG